MMVINNYSGFYQERNRGVIGRITMYPTYPQLYPLLNSLFLHLIALSYLLVLHHNLMLIATLHLALKMMMTLWHVLIPTYGSLQYPKTASGNQITIKTNFNSSLQQNLRVIYPRKDEKQKRYDFTLRERKRAEQAKVPSNEINGELGENSFSVSSLVLK